MKALARSCVWWPGIDRDLEMTVRNCSVCQETRPAPGRADLVMWPWPKRPWSRIHVDFAEPLKGKYIFIVVDAYSKWIEAEPCMSVTSSVAILRLRRMFARWGLPDLLCSDNATTFTSQEFQQFLAVNGIQHRTIEPRHSQGNGLAERAVRDVKQAVSKHAGNNWELALAEWLLYQRKIPHSTTSVSPSELMLGRVLRSRLDLLNPDLRSRVEQKQLQQKQNHDPEKPRTVPLSIGDAVYARNYSVGRAWFSGIIIGIDGPVSFVIKLEDGRVWRRHLDQIRPRGEMSSPSSTGAAADVAGGELCPDPEPPAAWRTDASSASRPAPDTSTACFGSPAAPIAPAPPTSSAAAETGADRTVGSPVVTSPARGSRDSLPASPPHGDSGVGDAVRRSLRTRRQTDFYGVKQ